MPVNESAEIVVIGGGVIGTATAYFLARKGFDIVLVEKKGIAAGTSGRCDGNVLVCDKMPGYDSRITQLSQDLFPKIADELDYDIGWIRRGSLLLIESEAEMAVARPFSDKLAAEGFPVRILDQREIHADEPLVAPDVIGAMETACDGTLNPMALAQGLAHGVMQRGGRLRPYTVVTDILLDGNGQVEGVLTDRGKILTPRVVNAAGIWAPAIGGMVGINLPIQPRQGQLLVSERTFRVGRRKMMEFGYLMTKFGGADYARDTTPEMEKHGVAFVFEPTEAGNFLIGSSRRFVGMDTTSDIEVQRAMAQRAIRFIPAIRDIRMIRSYTGLRPWTPDHYPIVSETGVPGFYVAAGHEGDGIGLSLITGKLMSQIIRGEPTDIDVGPLSINRFSTSTELTELTDKTD
jgi:glycine/D-amino acid oxidase-like deaminating enzyme